MCAALTIVEECDFPFQSMLDKRFIVTAYFRDSYRTTVSQQGASPTDIFQAIFAHHPMWIKIILVVRNRIAALGGLEAPTLSEIMNPQFKSSYKVGDKIGPWPIFALSESELIAGRDNKHLDFRLSVLRLTDEKGVSAIVSTVCVVHNRFGKVYLFFIAPFHRWGLRRLMASAVNL